MVEFNLQGRRIGTVAIFATLFVAIQVNGESGGCVYNFEGDNLASDFDLECNGVKNSWTLKNIEKDSPDADDRKVFVLEPEQEGCIRTKNPVTLNSTTRVQIKIGKDEIGEADKIIVRLLPVDGLCPYEECVWVPNEISKSENWQILEHRFPLKETRDCNIQVEVGKRKTKFELNSIWIPNPSGSDKCRRNAEEPMDPLEDHTLIYKRFIVGSAHTGSTEPGGSTGHGGSTTPKSAAPGLMEISKNLILTSASVLLLNHLFN